MAAQPKQGSRRPHRFAGMSKEDRHRARREVFIEAGIAVIGAVGITDIKVRDVCVHAELTERYFYQSFASLDVFAQEVVETVAMQVAFRLFGKAIVVDDGQDRLRTVVKELVAIVDEDPRVGRILFVETVRAGGTLAMLRQQMLYATTWLMTMWLDDNPDAPEVDLAEIAGPLLARYQSGGPAAVEPVVGDINMIAISGASAELLMAWIDKRLELSAEEMVDYLLTFIDQTVAWQKNRR
ncbi:TetR/AcrR family transcriptional regulator [Nocardia sp. CA-128927]|uniref:TetR/AcrR family transcriptional regulator n=1 Tax=Nocardia sp. CA-128927 TaxID=3239975 RepID=UPI003D970152